MQSKRICVIANFHTYGVGRGLITLWIFHMLGIMPQYLFLGKCWNLSYRLIGGGDGGSGGEGEYLLKKDWVISAYIPMDFDLKRYGQLFSLSFKGKRKKLNITRSITFGWLWKVVTTSSNSLIRRYRFSLSKSRKVDKICIIPSLKSIYGVLGENIIHNGMAIQIG